MRNLKDSIIKLREYVNHCNAFGDIMIKAISENDENLAVIRTEENINELSAQLNACADDEFVVFVGYAAIANPDTDIVKCVEFLTSLDETVHHVLFEKSDGSFRSMSFTRDLTMIPEIDHPTGNGHAKREGILPVYDLDDGKWKSFSIDKVISIRTFPKNMLDTVQNLSETGTKIIAIANELGAGHDSTEKMLSPL